MSTEAEYKAVRALLVSCTDPCIVDLGSFDGGDAEWMTAACAAVPRVVVVEPDERNLARLRARFIGRKEVKIYSGAVASFTGTCKFHVCDNAENQAFASGSIREPSGHLIHFPWCTFPKTVDVPCWTLDDIACRENLDHIDVLWVDIQGAEADMIRGGQMALARTRYLFIEAEEVEFYKGQVLRAELIAMLPGWRVIGDFQYNLLLSNEGLRADV